LPRTRPSQNKSPPVLFKMIAISPLNLIPREEEEGAGNEVFLSRKINLPNVDLASTWFQMIHLYFFVVRRQNSYRLQ
jgi:hypothetical protein